MEPPNKIRKLESDIVNSCIRERRENFLSSLSRQVSPPLNRLPAAQRQLHDSPISVDQSPSLTGKVSPEGHTEDPEPPSSNIDSANLPRIIPSPIQLTRIRDLPASQNVDTVDLHDILGDPLIKEAWIFNYCFDVEWLMSYFDQDVRHLIKVKIVHGFWRREDQRKLAIDEALRKFDNVESIQAYLPDAFGTHHSKMFVLFRHDDRAQVIIHTANMISQDWTNMTQAVWRSPLLPPSPLPLEQHNAAAEPIGSGLRFQYDLFRYLNAYRRKLQPLIQLLGNFDFSSIKAALIASVPSQFKIGAKESVWGHEALRRVIDAIPSTSSAPHYVFQVSSVATLPASWLDETLLKAIGTSFHNTSIIFPTAEDVRKSLDGYASGASIHTKAQSDTQLRQISRLRPQLCRWTQSATSIARSGRYLAAPHIKTYLCLESEPTNENPVPDLAWVLTTSANLSVQAWGSAPKPLTGSKSSQDAIIQVKSYEIGVLVWPALFEVATETSSSAPLHDATSKVRMIPTFKTDVPLHETSRTSAIGFRMPFDLPLTRYRADELPWSPQSSYVNRDRHGNQWLR